MTYTVWDVLLFHCIGMAIGGAVTLQILALRRELRR